MILAGHHAQAQGSNCAPRDTLIERLASQYGERRQAVGLANNNTLVEVYSSDESGSWSIVVSTAGGPSCLVAAGTAFQLTDDPLPDTNEGT